MTTTNQRSNLRTLFFTSFEKYQAHKPLEPLERDIVGIILEHPEYHVLLQSPEHYLEKDFTPEAGHTNPFLHLSLHLSLAEQIKTNRPSGIQALFHTLQKKYGDAHTTQHHMIEILATHLWEAQRNHTLPDETAYFEALLQLR